MRVSHIILHFFKKVLGIIFIELDLLIRIYMCYVTKPKHVIIVVLLNFTKS